MLNRDISGPGATDAFAGSIAGPPGKGSDNSPANCRVAPSFLLAEAVESSPPQYASHRTTRRRRTHGMPCCRPPIETLSASLGCKKVNRHG